MGLGDIAWVDGLPECVVWGWKEGFDAPGWARLVGRVDEVEAVLLGIEFRAESSWRMRIQLTVLSMEHFASFLSDRVVLTGLCTQDCAAGSHAMETKKSHVCCQCTDWAFAGLCKFGEMLVRPKEKGLAEENISSRLEAVNNRSRSLTLMIGGMPHGGFGSCHDLHNDIE